jgi:hypothetical protein
MHFDHFDLDLPVCARLPIRPPRFTAVCIQKNLKNDCAGSFRFARNNLILIRAADFGFLIAASAQSQSGSPSNGNGKTKNLDALCSAYSLLKYPVKMTFAFHLLSGSSSVHIASSVRYVTPTLSQSAVVLHNCIPHVTQCLKSSNQSSRNAILDCAVGSAGGRHRTTDRSGRLSDDSDR